MTNSIKCCTTNCDKTLDQSYWDTQYLTNTIGWDLGEVSPPIKHFFDSFENKNAAILIPGCGNSYEADYLLKSGFTNVTVIDIAPTLVGKLQEKHQSNPNIKIVLGDFFNHTNIYDLIVEQTFFCALTPSLRPDYVKKMHSLLAPNGQLVGLLFNRTFETSPPYGGSKSEYEQLFQQAFTFLHFELSPYSILPRAGSELWIEFKKNQTFQF